MPWDENLCINSLNARYIPSWAFFFLYATLAINELESYFVPSLRSWRPSTRMFFQGILSTLQTRMLYLQEVNKTLSYLRQC